MQEELNEGGACFLREGASVTINNHFSTQSPLGEEGNKYIMNKIKMLNNNNNENPCKIKPSSWDNENIFEKDAWLEAALTIFPLVLVLDDPVQTGIFLINLHPEPVDNPIFVILQSVVMEINSMLQI